MSHIREKTLFFKFLDQVWKEGLPWAMSATSQTIRVRFGAITMIKEF